MAIEFWMTPMGKTFYDRTMPELVRELHRLNNNLERVICTLWEGRIQDARRAKEPAREEA